MTHDSYDHLRESADAARAPLNEAERNALRAYMHGLNRAAAIRQGANPDLICPHCGDVECVDPEHNVLCIVCAIYPRLDVTVGGARHLCQRCLDRARAAFTST